MKEWLMPIVGTIIATVVIALANLFGSVSNNTKDIDRNRGEINDLEVDTEKKMVLYRGFILENRDRVTVLETERNCAK